MLNADDCSAKYESTLSFLSTFSSLLLLFRLSIHIIITNQYYEKKGLYDNMYKSKHGNAILKRESSVIRYLLSLTLIMLLSSLIFALSYYITLQSLENELQKQNDKNVEQAAKIFSERQKEVNNLMLQLGNNSMTYYMLNINNNWGNSSPDDIIYTQQYCHNLQSLIYPSELIQDIAVYSSSSNLVFHGSGIQNLSQWYRRFTNGVTEFEWLRILSEPGVTQSFVLPAQEFYDMGVSKTVLCYVQCLPLASRKRINGSICAVLDKEALFSGMLASVDEQCIFLVSQNGDLLASYGKNPFDSTTEVHELIDWCEDNTNPIRITVEGSKYLLSAASDSNGFRFILVSPSSALLYPAEVLRRIFIAALLLCLFFICIAVFIIINKIGYPYQKLVASNNELEGLVESQKADLCISIFRRLLTGYAGTRPEVINELNALDISWKNLGWVVTIIKLDIRHKDENESYENSRLVVMARVLQFIDSYGTCAGDNTRIRYVINSGIDLLSIVWGIRHDNTDDVDSFVTSYNSMIDRLCHFLVPYDCQVQSSAGNIYDDVFQLHTSYTEALFAIQSTTSNDAQTVQWYMASGNHLLYDFPIELEQQLIFGSSNGDLQIIKNTLDLIYQSNYIEKSISLGASRLLLLRLKTILLSACNEAEFEINQSGKSILNFANDGGEYSALHSFELLLQYYSGLCEKIRATQSIHNSELQNQLRAFVNENCFHPDMSLTYVASHFHVSENYISTVFKKITNVNFSTYIESLRLSKACELLSNTNDTLENISHQLGYSNVHSFRRAFKRKYGITPNMHRST